MSDICEWCETRTVHKYLAFNFPSTLSSLLKIQFLSSLQINDDEISNYFIYNLSYHAQTMYMLIWYYSFHALFLQPSTCIGECNWMYMLINIHSYIKQWDVNLIVAEGPRMLLLSNLPSPHPNQPSVNLQSPSLHPLSDPQTEQPIKTKLFLKFPFFWVITLDHWVIGAQSFRTMSCCTKSQKNGDLKCTALKSKNV